MLTVRLDHDMEALLDSISQKKGISKSAVVKEALNMYLKKEKATQTPYELGVDLFDSVQGKNTDSSKTYKKRLKNKLREKYSH